MTFRISNTFIDSLAKLRDEERKAVKMTAFDLQTNPVNPGFNFHKVQGAKDPNFRSVRVNRDIRLIVHQTKSSLLLCYVGHHDDAYHWAERRKLETHPKTGAAQLVQIREKIREIPIVKPAVAEPEKPAPEKPQPFADLPKDKLLGYGVPEEWLEEVYQANEDTILEIADHLPEEASEALLELATGGTPRTQVTAEKHEDPFEHPEAQRRFRDMNNAEALERALNYPWGKWMVFLHPVQQELVERDFNGPTRISGSAGTGKTIVALHRAVYLTKRYSEARVLLATFSEALASSLHQRLQRLISTEPRLAERLEVNAVSTVAHRLGKTFLGQKKTADEQWIKETLNKTAKQTKDNKFSPAFLWDEWHNVVDAWQINSLKEYQDVKRLGRKIRLTQQQREMLWGIFSRVKKKLKDKDLWTESELLTETGNRLTKQRTPPFDFIVIDELAYPQTLDSGKGKLRCIPTPFRKGFFLIRRRP